MWNFPNDEKAVIIWEEVRGIWEGLEEGDMEGISEKEGKEGSDLIILY